MTSLQSFMLFGHGGYLNRGCEAIVRSTATILSNVMVAGIPAKVVKEL